MDKIAGFNIEKKKLSYSLTSIFGIGKTKGIEICQQLNINPKLNWDSLTKNEQFEIIDFIERNYIVGDKKKQENFLNIKKLLQTNCYRGFRHFHALPTRGQRTHSNAKSFKRIRSIIKSKKKKKNRL